MSIEKQIQRIVDLRQSGLTWGQVEELMFPDSEYRKTGKGHRDSWKLARKYPALAAGAHAKKVYGCFGHIQIVEKLRDNVVPMVATEIELPVCAQL